MKRLEVDTMVSSCYLSLHHSSTHSSYELGLWSQPSPHLNPILHLNLWLWARCSPLCSAVSSSVKPAKETPHFPGLLWGLTELDFLKSSARSWHRASNIRGSGTKHEPSFHFQRFDLLLMSLFWDIFPLKSPYSILLFVHICIPTNHMLTLKHPYQTLFPQVT